MKNFTSFIASLGLLALITACSGQDPLDNGQSGGGPETNLVSTSKGAATFLARKVKKKDGLILTASFVNVDDLLSSSSLGRILSQQISGEIANQGFKIKDLLVRDSLYIKERAGEFLLSRQVKHLGTSHKAKTILVGTYAVGGSYVYVTARLVRTSDNTVVASHSYRIAMRQDIRELLIDS